MEISEERVRLFVTGCICLSDDEMFNMSQEQRSDIVEQLKTWDMLNAVCQ